MRVKVPVGAKVFVQDQEFKVVAGVCVVKGSQKQAPGEVRFFDLRVEFSDDAKQYKEFKRVRLFADKTTEVDYTDIVKPDKAKRTYAYWSEVNQIMSDVMGPLGKDAKDKQLIPGTQGSR